MDKRIFLDYASTTPLSTECYKIMLDSLQNTYGNSSSLHSFGRDANSELEVARTKVAKAINANSSEIYFTSGGSESNNWALCGLARANKDKGNHIIVSAIEHHSVLETCKALEKEGFVVSYIPVDKFGKVKYKELVKLIRKETILISVMTVNNEIGSIQPIKAVAELAKSYGVLVHTDAVQAIGTIDIDVKNIPVDALSMSAHKIYGPKGVGALYVREGVKIDKFIHGGEHERNMRAGTVNVPSIAGFGKAIELAKENMTANSKYLMNLKKYFAKLLIEKVPHTIINGNPAECVPNIMNISFQNIDGDAVLMLLDLAGIAVSTGAACASGVAKTSHVLEAMNTKRKMNSSIRVSFGTQTTKGDLDYVVQELAKAVANLRKMSPVKIKTNKGGKKDA